MGLYSFAVSYKESSLAYIKDIFIKHEDIKYETKTIREFSIHWFSSFATRGKN